jgi:CHRD domain/PEP-CTERM motif
MKLKLKLICAAGLALGASMPASALVTTFTTTLSGIGEPVPTSTATGAAVVSFDDAVNSITVLLSFAGLANSSPFGHIHCCTAVAGTGSGPVALSFTGLPAVTTGSYISFFPGAAAFNTILTGATAGKAYVNIHTPGTYAGGEIRGFLATTAVPEPGSYALLLAGIGIVGFLARRRSA